jgi:hypothetical protein
VLSKKNCFYVSLVLAYTLVNSTGCMVHSARDASTRPVTWAQVVNPAQGLQNFYQVDSGVYRAQQPATDALQQLQAGQLLTPTGQAFATIVSLRTTPSDQPLLAPNSQTRLIELPLDTWSVSDAQILQFLTLATDPKRQPLLVHCRHGADRTGTMVAAYRVVVQGWSKDEALAEMQEGGFGYHPIWVNLVHRIKNLPVEQMRTALQQNAAMSNTSAMGRQ